MTNRRCARRRLLAACLVTCTACGFPGRRVRPDERFTLHPHEKAAVAGTGLTVRLDAVGRRWYADGSPETPYVTLTVRAGGAPPRSLSLDDSQRVGGHAIRLVGANPSASGGGPAATLLATRR
jgi:hypothetical protein